MSTTSTSGTPTTHPVTPEDLMAFLDGELPAGRAQSVAAHTESCSDCRSLLQDLRQVRQGIGAWQIPSAPASIGAGIESAAASTFGAFGRLRFPPKRRWSRKQWTIALGFAAAALLLSFFTAIPNGLRPERPISNAALAQAPSATEVGHGSGSGNSPVFTSKLPASRGRSVNGQSLNGPVTLIAPGATADSNGLFHGLGDHAQNSFSIDGQSINDQQSRVFSGPMIARTVSLVILVKDFDASRKSVDAILGRHDGYSANLSVSTPQDSGRSLQGSLRVPAASLPAALAEFPTLGHVELETQAGEEVTAQHADLAARLRNARETENRFLTMLKERTGNLSEVLSAEEAIARVRGEIERMEAEQKNLEHRVDFAAIDLTLTEEYKAKLDSAAPSLATRFHNALVNGYRNVADTVVGLLLFFTQYGPVLLLWALLLLAPTWFVWRRWRQAVVAA
jgi:Domain of unknown function (DUF4349)/Putative zinc-finger